MQPDEFNRFADEVAERVRARLCTCGVELGGMSDAERRAQLKSDLEALAVQFSVRETVVARVRAEIAEHGFMIDKKYDQEGQPEVEMLLPPDFGLQGPSDEDIRREIEEIMKKIERLRKPREEEEYEFKLPFRVQINVALLVSILLELLKLILKLLERMRRIPQPIPDAKH